MEDNYKCRMTILTHEYPNIFIIVSDCKKGLRDLLIVLVSNRFLKEAALSPLSTSDHEIVLLLSIGCVPPNFY